MATAIVMIAPAFARAQDAPAPAPEGASPNLIKNAEFEMKDDKPVGWTDRTKPRQKLSVDPDAGHAEGKPALRVDITTDGGKTHGQVLQNVSVKPNTTYRLDADVKGGANQMAYVQIKLMVGKQEGKRISTPTNRSTSGWEAVSQEFTTEADTTGVQVICRFRMNESCVGKAAWFANPRLVQMGGGGEAAAAAPPPSTVAAVGADAYVTPDGSGAKDGTSWENALPGNASGGGGLQKAWNMAGPGNAVYVAGGEYEKATLTIDNGGSGLDKPKRLVGVDRGSGRPVFRAGWDKAKPASGPVLITIKRGVSFVEVRDLEVKQYRMAVQAQGRNEGLRIVNVDVQETRDAFWFDGGATAEESDAGSRDIVLRDCEVIRYTKRAMRTLDGVSHMQVVNCVADAGGKEYAAEVFPIGFHLEGNAKSKAEGVADHDITFINCESRGNYHDGGEKYWNADGFGAERNTYNITYIDCRAFDNTDGGWDVKSVRPKWVNCIAVGNKRNYRIWAKPGTEPPVLENCLSAFSVDYGQRKHDLGVWLQAGNEAVLTHFTAWGDRVAFCVDGEQAQTTVRLERCLIAPADGGKALRLAKGTDLQNSDSLIREADSDPVVQLRSPSPRWRGGDEAFDAASHPGLGYRYAQAQR